ncbi:MAG: c-type cytochrome [Rhodocyclaceae bacterium]|jgi:cytochrome c553|nr:c-type cytochrome [Rhodocyclaceae bacterium]
MHHPRHLALLATLILASAGLAAADGDLERGKEINGTCAACHGEFGQGGKKGEYPRIAGQPVRFIEATLKSFRARQRVNLPMYPYTQEREMGDQDIKDVAAYLAAIELPTKPPEFKDSDDALTRLQAMDKVMIVPRPEGNPEAGGRHYKAACAACHGKTGLGRGIFPRLMGQYTNYLAKQMTAFLAGERPHDEDQPGTGALHPLSDSDRQDILAYLTTLQNPEDTP